MSKIDFPVVGIGASAGGLKVLQDFFDHMDADSEMAYVVVTHLAPQRASAMDELLASHTSMNVQQVKNKTTIQRNHIYVIPPNKQLYMQGNQLLLAEKEKRTQAVIDVFFRSMARECEKRAIGVILSGTGSDGTLGLKAVKEYGGITMAQDPREAAYGEMPENAIETGLVDFVLPVKELAQKVIDHREVLGSIHIPLQEDELPKKSVRALQQIFGLLASKKGHDFKHYKRSSVLRRLQRRMYVTKNKSIEEYHAFLKKHPEEITDLFKDLLISVTNFFRDPEAFEALEKKIIPQLFENKKHDDPVRVWVTGCATGEEVYSLAILLHEYALKLNFMPRIKIFGTDISEGALSIARRGVYPEAIAADISPDRLQRYFHKVDSGYRVNPKIRENVLISNHDVLSDPPFLNQDLIACRNLLIYFNHELQNEVLKIVHYSLRTEGFLFLGMSDSTLGSADLFAPIKKKLGIYKARQVSRSQKDIPRFPLLPNMYRSGSFGLGNKADRNNFTFDKIHYSLLANQFAPASIIVDENNQVMHSSKGVDSYMRFAEGEPTRDLLKLVIPQIQRSLRNIIFQFNQMNEPKPVSQKVKVQDADNVYLLNISIQTIDLPDFPKGFRQIMFENVATPDTKGAGKKLSENPEPREEEIVEQLENELTQTKEHLQQIIEEYETSNEELMASNEELQSMNEELQTTTEELETSKEELQSVNEELRSVNQELEIKVEEHKSVSNDLKNLMEATKIGIVFVDKKMNIKLYTSNAKDVFHFIDSDLGRPLFHVAHELVHNHLKADIQYVLDDLKPVQKQVKTESGSWYKMHVKPYNTTESKAEGAVLAFVDITELKKAEEELFYRAKSEESIAELGKYMLGATNISNVITMALEMLAKKLKWDFTALLRHQPGQNNVVLEYGSGWPKNEVGKSTVELGNNSEIDLALKTEDPVVINDLADEERFEPSKLLSGEKITSGISIKVKGAENVYGVLSAYAREKRLLNPHEVSYVQRTANMISEVIERFQTQLKLKDAYSELEKKIEREKQLQEDILNVEKRERWRIGQYLHDETAQNLLGIKMLLDIISPEFKQLSEKYRQQMQEIRALIIESEKNIRQLSHFVLPIESGKNVRTIFQQMVRQIKDLYGIECTFETDGVISRIMDPASASSLYYMAQEAIRNAKTHGNADIININLFADSDFLYLTVKDNGSGYEKGKAHDGKGLNIMTHRAELLGGSLHVEKLKDEGGTLLTCAVPLDRIKE